MCQFTAGTAPRSCRCGEARGGPGEWSCAILHKRGPPNAPIRHWPERPVHAEGERRRRGASGLGQERLPEGVPPGARTGAAAPGRRPRSGKDSWTGG
ncbi:hypothetical protein GCM10022244_32300 [Streptomyces gulbargensis]|uniref:Uncharacterized protein n=1 Tax=Streptomyces gulbargensis TaxID=364901 RepID=A0ABP7MDA5_9ACTN